MFLKSRYFNILRCFVSVERFLTKCPPDSTGIISDHDTVVVVNASVSTSVAAVRLVKSLRNVCGENGQNAPCLLSKQNTMPTLDLQQSKV